MIKNKRKSRGLMITISFAGSALAYVFFIFLPGQLAVAELHSQLREQQMFVVQSERLKSAIQFTSKDLQRTESYVVNWQDNSPDDRSLTTLFADMMEGARQSGTHIQRFTPMPSVQMKSMRRVPVNVVGIGTYVQVIAFAAFIEQLPAAIWITDLHLSPTAEDSETLQCEMMVTIFANIPDISD